MRDTFEGAYKDGEWEMNGGNYKTKDAYKWLQGTQTKVNWAPIIWNHMTMHKHSIIGWIFVQNRLLTKDRMVKFGICHDNTCEMCGETEETHAHTFFM